MNTNVLPQSLQVRLLSSKVSLSHVAQTGATCDHGALVPAKARSRVPCVQRKQRRGRKRRGIAFVSAAGIGAFLRLCQVLRRQNAESDRNAGGKLNVHDSPRAFARHVIKVRCLTTYHRAECDKRIVAIGVDQAAARQWKLETARNLVNGDVFVGHPAVV